MLAVIDTQVMLDRQAVCAANGLLDRSECCKCVGGQVELQLWCAPSNANKFVGQSRLDLICTIIVASRLCWKMICKGHSTFAYAV